MGLLNANVTVSFLIFQDGATGMYALAQAMQNKELVAICTYVYRKGSNPKLVALVPRIRKDYCVFVMVGLPFSEDFR